MQGPFQEGKRETRTYTHEQITLLDLARAPAESQTHSTHVLRPRSSFLSHPLITPTTSILVQDNTRLPIPTRCRTFFGPNQYKLPVFFLHTIRIPNTQTHITSLVLELSLLTSPGRGFGVPNSIITDNGTQFID
jgi:hypothetical protein